MIVNMGGIISNRRKIQVILKHHNQTKSLDLDFQGTRKIGCMANITVKTYLLYPDYVFKNQGTCNNITSQCKKKQCQEEMLTKLRENLTTDKSKVTVIRKYLVSLPTEEAHHGHPTGKHVPNVHVCVCVLCDARVAEIYIYLNSKQEKLQDLHKKFIHLYPKGLGSMFWLALLM